eukprot:TRINITY_DN4150_c0_g1_i1.p1 TRINITY_DN4150_c0_g1~~TRINITY_DN4150_c0_g1_i1.p1  ORF type:complete len:568 (-),score=81.13 TRINITY_DN4150_c0_g1_i1:125-1828(-)
MVHYILVTGGVLSGVGKGVIASSTGLLLRTLGFRVTSIKIDPYINIDAGTMSPFEHGEVFVLDDGGEVDLDLGNYERFLDITLNRDNNITTGKIYKQVIDKERQGLYLGKTVQVVPHIVNEIKEWVNRVAQIPTDGLEGAPDVCVIELGGTVGDIESMPFVEAMRQMQFEKRMCKGQFCLIHVSLVPVIGVVGEQKTKPTQHSVRELRALGLNPDFIICRSTKPLSQSTKDKISNFCHVVPERVIGVHDVSNIYRVPLLLDEQSLSKLLLAKLQVSPTPSKGLELADWGTMADHVDIIEKSQSNNSIVYIAMVGKYTGLSDSYLSVVKALKHAAYACHIKLEVIWIEATDLEIEVSGSENYKNSWDALRKSHGILVPGGFGDRGTEGKILAANYARENKIPYLGICLGLQIAVIEYARNILGWKNATSEEFEPESNNKKVVIFMPEISRTTMGGTMRLGRRTTILKSKDCLSYELYGKTTSIVERHRHRYEVNPAFVSDLEKAGLLFVGINDDETGERQEIIELPTSKHPFFLGVQYHPEFKSRPLRPSPPFLGLVKAARERINHHT